MQLGSFRRIRDLASLARALFATGFGLDVAALVAFVIRRALVTVDVEYLWRDIPPVDVTGPELILAASSVCALAVTLRRAALNARSAAPGSSPLWKLGLRLLLPWNPRGREALIDLWRASAPPEDAKPPASVKLLWWLWSCWLPLAVLPGLCQFIWPVPERLWEWRPFMGLPWESLKWMIPAWNGMIAGISCLHAGLSACVVLAVGAIAAHQEGRSSPAPALPPNARPRDLEPAPRVQVPMARPQPATPPRADSTLSPTEALICPNCGHQLRDARCSECGAAAMAGAYRIDEVLGAVADRRTYLARGRTGERVTLKEVAMVTAPDAYTLDAFEREAQLLRQLDHPSIPRFVDAFRIGEGKALRFYLAHRFVEGVSLEEESRDRFYTEREALGVLDQILRVVVHLQSLSPPVFHRDIKPSNLIRRADGSLALVDFGAARERQGTLRSATMVGSVGYMPPEQLAGQVDRTSDPYAAGATALQMLTRRQPWEFMDGPILRLPDLPISRGAQKLIARLLSPSKEKRFTTAADALRALERLREGRNAWAPA